MKVSEDTIHISRRFFEVLNELIARGDMRGRQTFTTRYGIDKRNFYKVEKDLEKQSVNMVWIAHLARDYGVSSHWVLTGRGEMFSGAKTPQNRKKPTT